MQLVEIMMPRCDPIDGQVVIMENVVGARFSCKHPPNNRVDHYEHTKQNSKNQILHVDKFWLKITTDTFPEIIIITLCNSI